MNDLEYSQYLQKRSVMGGFYRHHILYPRIAKMLKGNRVLDLGCGIGDFLKFYPAATGVDVNPCNIAICKSYGLNVHHMDFDKIPFGNNSFDSVLMDNVLEHILNPKPLLSEIKRVLTPSGHLIVGVPGLAGQISDADHKVYYDDNKLEMLALQEGFTIHKRFYAPFFKSQYLSEMLPQYCIYSQWIIKE